MVEEEVQQERIADIERAAKVKHMLNHPGWRDVVGPELKRKRQGLLDDLLRTPMSKSEEFILVRQSINAIDAITEFIDAIMLKGENAQAEMEAEKGNEEE